MSTIKKSLLELPGIGPTKAQSLITAGVTSVEDLKKPEFNALIPKETQLYLKYPTVRINWDQANDIAEFLISHKCGEIVVGSVRRKRPTTGDIDILTERSLDSVHAVIQTLRSQAFKYMGAIAEGPQRLSIICRWRDKYVHVDIFRVNTAILPFALLHYTGPYELNIAMRKVAIAKGMKLSQYGLTDKDGNVVECKSEKEIFDILGIVYKAPAARDVGGIKMKTTKIN